MATSHIYRLIFIVPSASKTSFNNWIRNNIDPNGGDWFDGLGLSATGVAPATHFWCSAQLTAPEFKTIGLRLCTISGVAAPGQWDTWNRTQKKQWYLDNKAGILAGSGVRIFAMDNDAVWSDPGAALAEAGLQVIQPTP